VFGTCTRALYQDIYVKEVYIFCRNAKERVSLSDIRYSQQKDKLLAAKIVARRLRIYLRKISIILRVEFVIWDSYDCVLSTCNGIR